MEAFPVTVHALINCFLEPRDRVGWWLAQPPATRGVEHYKPTPCDVRKAVADSVAADTASIHESDEWFVDIYSYPRLLRLVLEDEGFVDLRGTAVRLADAVERGCASSVIELMVDSLDNLSAEDRARSFILLAAAALPFDKAVLRRWRAKFPVSAIQYPPEWLSKLEMAAAMCGEEDLAKCFAAAGNASSSPNDRTSPPDGATGAADRSKFYSLEQACAKGELEVVDTLLSQYLADGDAAHSKTYHPRFLQVAIENRRWSVVELLLTCDPRGRVTRSDQLLHRLRQNNAGTATIADILTGGVPKYASIAWDGAALKLAVDTDDGLLLQFLLHHVSLPECSLQEALSHAIGIENRNVAATIADQIAARHLLSATSSRPSSVFQPPPFVYTVGEQVAVQHSNGVHYWSGTILRCWLNGTYDIQLIDHSSAAVEEAVPAHVIRARSIHKLELVRQSAITTAARCTANQAILTAARSVKTQFEVHGVQSSMSTDLSSSNEGENDDESQAEDYESDSSPVSENGEGNLVVDTPAQQDEPTVSDTRVSIAPDTGDSESASCIDDALIDQLPACSEQEQPHTFAKQPQPAKTVAQPAVVSCSVSWKTSSSKLSYAPELHENDEVRVRVSGREPSVRGTIARCRPDKTYDVEYDDGRQESAVAREYIKLAKDDRPSTAPDPLDLPSEAFDLDNGDMSSPASSEGIVDDDGESYYSDEEVGDQAHSNLSSAGSRQDIAALSCDSSEVIPGEEDSNPPPADEDFDPLADDVDDSSTPVVEMMPSLSAAASTAVDQPLVELQSTSTDTEVLTNDHEVVAAQYRLGEEVEANFLSIGKFHGARIVHVHTGDEAYDVAYCDFDQTELRVRPEQIRPRRGSSHCLKSLLKSPSSVAPLNPPDEIASTPDSSNMNESTSKQHSTTLPVSWDIEDTTKADETRKTSEPSLSVPLEDSVGRPTGRAIVKSAPGRHRHLIRNQDRNSASSREVEEWKNVDIILSRKRRLLNTPTGNVESIKVPWGEEFATIQSLKRFATQHPEVLREHIRTHLGVLTAQVRSPAKKSSPSPRKSSSSQTASDARDSLLLVKDLAFLLKQRLAPFFDVIVPVVLPAVFTADRRFLCDTAYEVLEALVLHCSGRRLALELLQQGELFNTHDDSRLLNLTSLYVEKCFANFSSPELKALVASESPRVTSAITNILGALLVSKSIPTRIAIEKSLRHIRRELGDRRFELFVQSAFAPEKAATVLGLEQLNSASDVHSPTPKGLRNQQAHMPRDGSSGSAVACQSPSILQRMLQQRHSRVRPSQG